MTSNLTHGRSAWSTGCSAYFADHEIGHHGQRWTVLVTCRFAALPPTLAFLDTGCTLSVVGGELAEILEGTLGQSLEAGAVDTRLGRFDGLVYACPVTLVATEGHNLTFSARLLVVRDELPFPPVLGYRACLDRIRFALDPGVGHGDERFYFGKPGDR